MSALNPNHPVTDALSDQWHKILMAVFIKLGLDEIVITNEDVLAIGDYQHAIMAHAKPDGLHIAVITEQEAQLLARQHGGLPN
jgi:hypothetical protein